MSKNSEIFLSAFNRIESYIKNELQVSDNMGFSEAVRRLGRKNSAVKDASDDLIQMAQLRNAIIHEKISENFVIAEPNDWAVNRILEIEKELTNPELVFPRFEKRVVGFEENITLQDMLKKIANNHYSQFPIYRNGIFQGLITIRGIAIFIADASQKGPLDFKSITAKDFLALPFKKPNYCFTSPNETVQEVKTWFQQEPTLEAVLITKNGKQDGSLVGIIRPRDIA